MVHEPAHYPKIEPSHYAQVHGVEPFERGNMKPWDLHVIPTGAYRMGSEPSGAVR